MKQVIVNGQSYLAEELVQGDNALIVVGALATGPRVTKGDVAAYMKAENLDELKDITFGGAGVSFSEVALDKDIEFAIKVNALVMEEAADTAVKKLVNREFDNGLGAFAANGAGTADNGVWRA